MNTAYAIGNIHFRFESRARRRWFVALFYVAIVTICLAWCSVDPKQNAGAWIVCGCMILGVSLASVFSGISGDMHIQGDEREMQRRGQAYFNAHALFGKFVIAALIADAYFRGRNPLTPLLPPALRGGMMDGPYALLMALGLLCLTLPQAILLWTEPDIEEMALEQGEGAPAGGGPR